MEKKKTTAIILAAGQGKRMNSSTPKQYLKLLEKPILYYSLRTFSEDARIDEIILVTEASQIAYCKQEIIEKYNINKVSAVVCGGKERYHSVYEGLKACKDTDIVFIHDGARPFVEHSIIERTYVSALQDGACVASMPSKDTVKISDESGYIKYTPDRSTVWSIQTPQVFRYDLVKKAYDLQMANENPEITDDAMVVEKMLGIKVKLVEGSYKNIKITTPEDLDIGQIFIKEI